MADLYDKLIADLENYMAGKLRYDEFQEVLCDWAKYLPDVYDAPIELVPLCIALDWLLAENIPDNKAGMDCVVEKSIHVLRGEQEGCYETTVTWYHKCECVNNQPFFSELLRSSGCGDLVEGKRYQCEYTAWVRGRTYRIAEARVIDEESGDVR